MFTANIYNVLAKPDFFENYVFVHTYDETTTFVLTVKKYNYMQRIAYGSVGKFKCQIYVDFLCIKLQNC